MKIQLALVAAFVGLVFSTTGHAAKFGTKVFNTQAAAAASIGSRGINKAVPKELRDLYRKSTAKTVSVTNVRDVRHDRPSMEFSVTTNPKPGRYDNKDLNGSALVIVKKSGKGFVGKLEVAQHNTYE